MSVNMLFGGAAISIVLVSWGFYLLVVPKGWREWTRAGIVQAFFIAFYAEMYGFPVTIYLLARIFNLDVAGDVWDGNLWVYLTGSRWAMPASMTVGYTLVVFGALLLIAGWREVHRASAKRRIATRGPYALMRHPQYTAIFLALFGEGVVHWPTLFSLTAFPIIVIAYSLLARKEEQQMMKKFGDKYRVYQQRVPMFLPDRNDWGSVFRDYQI
ncbi:isoprenylcysteine carboxylmethyltransferase family protein [Bradyrhizobium sp. 186]|uniref:methyltransferase family protein n=1 Tax=Bradyrhizobium sp. 186 TaxID=2782654 RepID=UPI0020016B84|nr:isoprenylcysteine carboxylmethyltransferase family protein [Bradyrhizobium sp. 186]UPK37851.1 isoprenylcysteine carboxylmethyltransferase family protein [Bradyrhizobium sp. 186]